MEKYRVIIRYYGDRYKTKIVEALNEYNAIAIIQSTLSRAYPQLSVVKVSKIGKGHWICRADDEGSIKVHYRCSECNHFSVYPSKNCSECGAEMDFVLEFRGD